MTRIDWPIIGAFIRVAPLRAETSHSFILPCVAAGAPRNLCCARLFFVSACWLMGNRACGVTPILPAQARQRCRLGEGARHHRRTRGRRRASTAYQPEGYSASTRRHLPAIIIEWVSSLRPYRREIIIIENAVISSLVALRDVA